MRNVQECPGNRNLSRFSTNFPVVPTFFPHFLHPMLIKHRSCWLHVPKVRWISGSGSKLHPQFIFSFMQVYHSSHYIPLDPHYTACFLSLLDSQYRCYFHSLFPFLSPFILRSLSIKCWHVPMHIPLSYWIYSHSYSTNKLSRSEEHLHPRRWSICLEGSEPAASAEDHLLLLG